jgi:hypothetical protein
MRLQDIIRADKKVTDNGKWDTGKMPRTAFLLSHRRSRSYRLGSYRWRVLQFDALGSSFRLLVAYHFAKEQYRAVLAVERDRDMAVLAQYEFHGTHPGWHVLATCGDIASAYEGVMRYPGQRRLPKARSSHRRQDFGITNDNYALTKAARFFQIHKAEGLLI